MNPEFSAIPKPFANRMMLSGQEYLYFGGTAYLGIPQHQAFRDLYIKGIETFGLNNGTSRNNNVQLSIYSEAEECAASRFKAESALITSSGYLAAQLSVRELSKFGEVMYAPATHPALWLNEQPQHTESFSAWLTETVNRINQSSTKNWVLISNSMNNLFPEIYDFTFLKQIHPDKSILLIVDDSHGIGVNNSGRSAYSGLPKQSNLQCIVVASMAKALGIDAGLVLGPEPLLHQLKNTNVFLGASPPAAAGLYAFTQAADLYQTEWEKLQQNILLLNKQLGSNWQFVQGFPAFFLDDPDLHLKLLKHNILISSFPYPTKQDQPINRLVLSSWHQQQDLDQLATALRKI